MKYPITTEVDELFTAWEEDDVPRRPMFCVIEQRLTPYCDDRNYRRFSKSDPDVWRSETLDALYEIMAKVRVDHTLEGERQHRSDSWLDVEDFTVEFSNIFIEVEPYDEARLKATTTYQNLGKARDEQRERERVEAEKQRELSRAFEAKRKEEHDRAEFERLKKKFNQ